MWKNVNSVSVAGIRTHDLLGVSLFSKPLDKGSAQMSCKFLHSGKKNKNGNFVRTEVAIFVAQCMTDLWLRYGESI